MKIRSIDEKDEVTSCGIESMDIERERERERELAFPDEKNTTHNAQKLNVLYLRG